MKRNTRVSGRNYVVHYADGERTLCGRKVSAVNCGPGPSSALESAGGCESCLAKLRARESAQPVYMPNVPKCDHVGCAPERCRHRR